MKKKEGKVLTRRKLQLQTKKALSTHGPQARAYSFSLLTLVYLQTVKRAARYSDLFCHISFTPDL